jgi:hypothetical protein
MEFKGTKGKWFSSSLEIISMPTQTKIGKISGNNYEEARFNALLTSKAPIHLEELQELFEKLSNGTISIYNSDGGNISDAYKKHYNKLIKEATEI